MARLAAPPEPPGPAEPLAPTQASEGAFEPPEAPSAPAQKPKRQKNLGGTPPSGAQAIPGMQMPSLSVSDAGGVDVTGGMDTLDQFRSSGQTMVPVAMDAESAQNAKELGLIGKAPKTAAKTAAAAPEVSDEVIGRIGQRPDDDAQAAIWDRIATRLGKGKEFEGGIPLVPLKSKKGEFRVDGQGEPLYEQHDYHITNSPLLQKQKQALAHDEDAPEGTEDTLGNEFHFLNPTERLRLSHLVKSGAVDTFADKLSEEYQKHEDIPEVMKGKGWYAGVRAELKKYLGAHSDLFANLLAATSARQQVVPNWNDALHAYDKFRRGDYDKHIKLYREAYQMRDRGELLKHVLDSGISQGLVDKGISKKLPTTEAGAMADWITHHDIVPKKDNGAKYGMNSDQVLKVLASTWAKELKGPKTANFSGNLGGKTLEATIDMWAARTMRRLGHEGYTKEPHVLHPPQEQAVHNLDFAFSQLAFRKAAQKHGLTPDDLQAILWYAEQRHWNKKGWSKDDVTKKDYRPLLKTLKELPHKPAKKPHEWEPEPKAKG